MTNQMISKVEGQELILERVFHAPRQLVFKAFSEAEHLKHWWGPRGWTLSACTVDFQEGGVWHYCMKCLDKNQGDFYGMESWGKAVYKEIVDGEKIVYVDFFSDAEGNELDTMPSAHVTTTFLEQDGQTKLISRSRYASADELKKVMEMGMEQGITETWDRLSEHLQAVQS
ncbi:SRPBCC domain-containing protein [Paenibacillus paridis]|uniref:SRPBCC domain-containing protein n=1 Tax=Paenibacillus paridis TaxID=2583376 RepID=UPI00111E6556|nr:SRPBCC domain-containing protein [Paenibacillus paridis]